MKVRIKYFAAARERAGVSEEELELAEGAPVSALLAALVARHPALERLIPHLRVAVNEEFAALTEVVPAGAEVALIPPVAGGGSARFAIFSAPLELQRVVDAVSGPGQGGLVTFSGAVRDNTKGKKVMRLEYEAYEPMALKKMELIAQEAAERWPGAQVAIHHRTGVLKPGELAVVIAASAPHRKEAFRACEHAIDRLKQDVPIWKREVFEDGEVWVGLGP
jgi:MoaE-MoaD fusion protein